jgi:ComF family protein
MLGEILAATAAASADHLHPRLCALCGASLYGSASAPPLCPACRARLVPTRLERCRACGKPLISEEGLCMRCRASSWSFDAALPLFNYSGPAEALVSVYKFGGRLSLAPFIADLMEEALVERWPGWPLVPVPPRRNKIRKRGWDQVETILRRLELRGFRAERLLERRASREQKRLGLEDRFANARSAYGLAPRAPGAAMPSRLVLLDDVFTTGATADACARALKEGGALEVAVLAIAAD